MVTAGAGGLQGGQQVGFAHRGRAAQSHLLGELLELGEPELNGESIAEAALKPTRIYVPAVLAALRKGLPIHGVAHITGGGISENLNRVLPPMLDAAVDKGTWDVPPIIDMVVRAAHLSDHEAYRTFNMGVGMAIIVDRDAVDDVAEALEAAGEKVFPIGEIVPGTGKVVYR